jgi:hypothetical protein
MYRKTSPAYFVEMRLSGSGRKATRGGPSGRSVPAMPVRDAVCSESHSAGAGIRDIIQTDSPMA